MELSAQEQAQIDQALARNADLPALRDEDGKIVNADLKAAYDELADADRIIAEQKERKRDAHDAIVSIEHADNQARVTGVTHRIGG